MIKVLPDSFATDKCQSKPDLKWLTKHQFTLNFSLKSSSLAKLLRIPFFQYLIIYSLQLDLCFDHTSRIAGQSYSQKSWPWPQPSALRHYWIQLLACLNSEYCLLLSSSVNKLWSSARKHTCHLSSTCLIEPLSLSINILSYYSSSEFPPFKAKSTAQMSASQQGNNGKNESCLNTLQHVFLNLFFVFVFPRKKQEARKNECVQ